MANMSMVKTLPSAQKVEERIKNYDELYKDYTLDQAMEEANRCLQCPARYCSQACPIHNNIPEFIKELQSGNVDGAYKEIEKVSPMPEACSRICPQYKQCERNCTRGLNGESVSIGKLERFVADTYLSKQNEGLETSASTGKKVSIIGAGPAGLAAASRLVRDGYDVRVYERADRVGGLMMYGIPNMKLGKDTLTKKIEILEKTGVKFVTGTDVADQAKADEILKGSDAVLLACGASQARDIQVPGRDGDGVHFAVDYLKANTAALMAGKTSDVNADGLDVIVIGGGDTGNDCVATAVRQGCKSIRQLEMMPRETDPRIAAIPWTEFPVEPRTDYGQEDAICKFGSDPRQFLTTVKEMKRDASGNLTSVTLVQLETAIEGTKVFQKEIPGTDQEVAAQMVIIAAGFTGCQDYVADAFGVERDKRGNVKTEYLEHATNVEKVYVAGDMNSGQSVVAKAIKDGLDAALEIEAALS